MQILRELWEFLESVRANWVFQMSGLAGVLLGIAGSLPDRVAGRLPATRPMFWVASAICIIVAMYLAWVKEHRARLAAEVRPKRIAKIVEALGSNRLHVAILTLRGASGDATELAADLATAFCRAGWRVDEGVQDVFAVQPSTGIAIELLPETAPRSEPRLPVDRIRALMEAALVSAGINISVRPHSQVWTMAHACILISHKPD